VSRYKKINFHPHQQKLLLNCGVSNQRKAQKIENRTFGIGCEVKKLLSCEVQNPRQNETFLVLKIL